MKTAGVANCRSMGSLNPSRLPSPGILRSNAKRRVAFNPLKSHEPDHASGPTPLDL
jgi:hypothetical protein